MIWSVYRYDQRAYDYYEAPGPKGTHASAPPKPLLAPASMGVAPEHATWKLPAGARKIGSGPMPRGRVASTGSALGLGDFELTRSAVVITIGVLAAVMYAARRKR